MPKFEVTVTEEVNKVYEIEAKDKEEAEEKVIASYSGDAPEITPTREEFVEWNIWEPLFI